MLKLWQKIVRAYVFRPPVFLIPGGAIAFLMIAYAAVSLTRSRPKPFLEGCKPVAMDIAGADVCESDQPFPIIRSAAEDWARDEGVAATSTEKNHLVLKGSKESYEIVAGHMQGEDDFVITLHGPTTIITHHELSWKEKAVESVKGAAVR